MLIREKESYWWISTHLLIGSFYTSQGKIDSAQKYLNVALSGVAKGKIPVSDSLELRGSILHELMRDTAFSEPEVADSLFEESLLLFRLVQNEPAIARLRLGLAAIKVARNELEQAKELIDKVLVYATEQQDIILQAEALQRKGLLLYLHYYQNEEDESYFEAARTSLQEVLNLQTNNKYYTYDLLGNLYQFKFSATGELEAVKMAITYFKWAIINAREEGQLVLVKNMGSNISDICSVLAKKLADVDCEEILGESTAEFLNTNYTGIVDSITLELTDASVQSQRYQRMELESASSRKRMNQLLVFGGILLTAGLIFLILLQQQQKRRLKARMEALRAQINPHFISNSLNAIESLVNLNKREQASKYLVHFSRLSRRILNSSREANTSLKGELETLKHFLALEQLRFRDKLSYSIEVQEGINPLLLEVPSMIMQPYVENAIWHGLKPKASPGKLSIYVSQEGKSLVCSIEDDGIGREKSRELKEKSVLKRKSLGMQITEERLQVNQKAKAGSVEIIDLKDEEGNALGTRVMLYLPIKKRKQKTDSTPLT
jgi:two-component sensor histidine kinase